MPNFLEKTVVEIIEKYNQKSSSSVQDSEEILDSVKRIIEKKEIDPNLVGSFDISSLDSVDINSCVTFPSQTAIHLISLCVIKNLPNVAIYLLDKGADPDLQRNWDGKTALHFAVDLGNLAFIEILSLYNANFNSRTYDGMNPILSISSKLNPLNKEQLKAVQMVINYGGDINSKDIYKKSAMHYAVQNCQCDLIRLLLDNNVDCNLADNDGKTVFNIIESLDYNNKEKVEAVFNEYNLKIVIQENRKETIVNNYYKNRLKSNNKNKRIGGFKK